MQLQKSSTSILKIFYRRSYIFGIVTHFLVRNNFLNCRSSTPLNTTREGGMVQSIDDSSL